MGLIHRQHGFHVGSWKTIKILPRLTSFFSRFITIAAIATLSPWLGNVSALPLAVPQEQPLSLAMPLEPVASGSSQTTVPRALAEADGQGPPFGHHPPGSFPHPPGQFHPPGSFPHPTGGFPHPTGGFPHPTGGFPHPTGWFPTGVFPTGVWPTGVFPTGVFPTGVWPTVAYPTGASSSGAPAPLRVSLILYSDSLNTNSSSVSVTNGQVHSRHSYGNTSVICAEQSRFAPLKTAWRGFEGFSGWK